MKSLSFSLEQFQSAGLLPELKITGNIGRGPGTLAVSYELLGPLTGLVFPPLADMCMRRNLLWEETCFELFLASENSDQYWEFNLSPAGHWNVYRFKAYREGMREETAFTSLPFTVEVHPKALRLSMELNLTKIVRPERTLKVGISAVIKNINGKITYWALTHPGSRADFHRRDSFIIKL